MSNRAAAHLVKALSSLVASTVTLTTRLDPDNSIDISVVEDSLVGSGAGTETSTLDVAPLAPLLLDLTLTGAALVNNEVCRVASLLEVRSEGLDVVVLIPRVGPLSEVLAGVGDVLVVVGDVGSKTTDSSLAIGGVLSALEDLSEKLCRGS